MNVSIRSLLVLVLLFCSVLSIPMRAVAATLYGVSAYASTVGTVSNSGDLSTSAQSNFFILQVFEQGSSNAAIGLLDATSFAATNQPYCGSCGNAAATAGSSFFDTLTVTGTPGGSGNFLIGLFSTNSTLAPGSNGGNASIDAVIIANAGWSGGSASGSSQISEFYTTLPGNTPQITTTPAFILTVPVGGTITLNGHVDTGVVSVDTGNASTASDRMQFFISPQTSGIGFTAASGVTYLTSVPIPGSLALLASGIALIGFLSRRSRTLG